MRIPGKVIFTEHSYAKWSIKLRMIRKDITGIIEQDTNENRRTKEEKPQQIYGLGMVNSETLREGLNLFFLGYP